MGEVSSLRISIDQVEDRTFEGERNMPRLDARLGSTFFLSVQFVKTGIGTRTVSFLVVNMQAGDCSFSLDLFPLALMADLTYLGIVSPHSCSTDFSWQYIVFIFTYLFQDRGIHTGSYRISYVRQMDRQLTLLSALILFLRGFPVCRW